MYKKANMTNKIIESLFLKRKEAAKGEQNKFCIIYYFQPLKSKSLAWGLQKRRFLLVLRVEIQEYNYRGGLER